MTDTTFLPDWASPPGATVNDILERRSQTLNDFAREMKISMPDARRLIKGSSEITRESAQDLARVLGISAEFWLNRETHFRQALVRADENEKWLKQFPLNDMAALNWIPQVQTKKEKIGASLEFFGVATISEWWLRYKQESQLTVFRTSKTFESKEAAVIAWLRKGELEASSADCQPWSPEKLKAALPSLRKLTRKKDPNIFIPELQNICAQCGVAVVVEQLHRVA